MPALNCLIVDYSASVSAVTMTDPSGSLAGYSGTIADSGGNNAVFDGVENFNITAGSGNNLITTGGGNDVVAGGNGQDNLNGGAGQDSLYGGGGNDTLIGAAGNDTMYGGDGSDTASYRNGATAGVTVNLSVSTQNTGGAGVDTLFNFENLTGTDFNDNLSGNSANNSIYGAAGNDTLIGAAGDDTLMGGAGNDTLYGGAGSDTASYQTGATAGVTVNLALSTQNTGGAGVDTLFNIENLVGSAFNDTLTGNAGANRLSGLAGNDRLVGGAGNDSMDGGAGADSFVFGTGFGKDTVTGFAPMGAGHDTIDFSTSVFANFGAVQSHMVQSGLNVVITLDAANTVTLTGVTLASLTSADFTFHPGASPAPSAAAGDWATHGAEFNSLQHVG